MRENFLERKLDFNGILTKKPVFDKKVVKTSFTTQVNHLHQKLEKCVLRPVGLVRCKT